MCISTNLHSKPQSVTDCLFTPRSGLNILVGGFPPRSICFTFGYPSVPTSKITGSSFINLSVTSISVQSSKPYIYEILCFILLCWLSPFSVAFLQGFFTSFSYNDWFCFCIIAHIQKPFSDSLMFWVFKAALSAAPDDTAGGRLFWLPWAALEVYSSVGWSVGRSVSGRALWKNDLKSIKW